MYIRIYGISGTGSYSLQWFVHLAPYQLYDVEITEKAAKATQLGRNRYEIEILTLTALRWVE